jgi:replicative DNA helicase
MSAASVPDRTPPNDEQAEQALIGHTLNLGRIPEAVNGLAPSDFYRPVNETVWAAVRDLAEQQKPCDIPLACVVGQGLRGASFRRLRSRYP